MIGLKLIIFDLDNILWLVDEVIWQVEKICSDWIVEYYFLVVVVFIVEWVCLVCDELVCVYLDYLNNLICLCCDVMVQVFIEVGFKDKEVCYIVVDVFQVFYEVCNQVMFFFGVLEVLEILVDSYILGVFSNGNVDFKWIGICELFGFYYFVESIGWCKLDLDMFQVVLYSVGVQLEQVFYVGDYLVEDVDVVC